MLETTCGTRLADQRDRRLHVDVVGWLLQSRMTGWPTAWSATVPVPCSTVVLNRPPAIIPAPCTRLMSHPTAASNASRLRR